jgi:hypothetical protein
VWAQTSHSGAAVGALSLSGDVMIGLAPTVAVRRIWESVPASALATSPPVETQVEHRRRLLGRSSLKNARGPVY